MSSKPRFVINKRGVLEKCYGPEGEIVIPEKVKVIGERAFEKRGAVVRMTIPKGVTRIEEGAFLGCGALESVDIPEGVTFIGSKAFSYSGLTSVTIPESVKRIDYEAFAYCKNLTSVTVPKDIDIRISGNAFVYTPWRKSLGEVAVLNHVLLDYQAHEGLYSQWDEHIEVTIPENVKVIGDYAFEQRHALSGVIIPEGVTEIGARACEYCRALTSVAIPNGVTQIGYDAFAGCLGLSSITIPASVTKIGEHVFGEDFINHRFCENVTIHAPAGSCAERHARENDIKFQPL